MTCSSLNHILLISGLVISCCSTAGGQNSGLEQQGQAWVDLTHSFDKDTLYWPTEPGFMFERGSNGPTKRGYYYAANRFSTAEHGGTHIDAPQHFSMTGKTVDTIPLGRLTGEAAVIDISDLCEKNPLYQINIDDLIEWENRNRRTLRNCIVLLRTGWGSRWPDAKTYLGTTEKGSAALKKLRFPGLSHYAAEWLVKHRHVKAVGIDTASIDYGQSTYFEAHVTLCRAQTPIFENVANLATLPEVGCEVIALPMKITGGSGGPLRIIARPPPPISKQKH